MKQIRKIGVIGCGRWGTFLAWYLNELGHEVTLYGRKSSARMEQLIRERKNEYVEIPERLQLTQDLTELLEKEILVISIGAQNLSDLMAELASYGMKDKTLVLCMKGIEMKTGRRLSEIVKQTVDPSNHTAVWLGPGHVEDYYKNVPNCMVIDGEEEAVKEDLVEIFSGPLIRFYYGTDLLGNEIGAATKNVMGIAAGMLDGLGLSSLKGALMTRGTREIARLIQAMGGNELSAYGLCHLGDYEATLFSAHSHNRGFGEKFVRGESYDKLAEGYYTVRAVVELAEKLQVEVPICNMVYQVLYKGKEPREGLELLFQRSLKEEFC